MKIILKGWWWKKYFTKYQIKRLLIQAKVNKWLKTN